MDVSRSLFRKGCNLQIFSRGCQKSALVVVGFIYGSEAACGMDVTDFQRLNLVICKILGNPPRF